MHGQAKVRSNGDILQNPKRHYNTKGINTNTKS